MRYRACHTTNRGEPLRVDQSAILLLNLIAHLGEYTAQIAHLLRSPCRKQILRISFSESLDPGCQLLQWTCDHARQKQHEQRTNGDGQQAGQKYQAIDITLRALCLSEGLHDDKTQR